MACWPELSRQSCVGLLLEAFFSGKAAHYDISENA